MTLLFNEDTHTYTLAGTGGSYTIPSVSQIIKRAGMYDYPQNEKSIDAMNFGTHVHKLTHLYDQKFVAPQDVMGRDRAYLEVYEKFCREVGFATQVNEAKYYHRLYMYAGTIDKIGTIEHPQYSGRCHIDLKTGQPHPANRIQVAAYHRMLEDCGEKIDRSILLYINENGYKIVELDTISHHFDVFLSALTLSRWKEANKIGQRTGR